MDNNETGNQHRGGQQVTGPEFRRIRETLGLSYGELGLILGGIRADTIRKKWERDNPPPSPIACQVLRWMIEGYRPPEWPDRLPSNDDMICAASETALLNVERKTGKSRWDCPPERALDILRATAALHNGRA